MQWHIGSWIGALDDLILLWLNQFMTRWPALDRAGGWLLTASIFKLAPFVMVICWFWFDTRPQQARRRRLLVELIGAGLMALFVGRLLALLLPFRDRPLVRPDLHFLSHLESGARTWSSFPSDHAVVAFAIAASMVRISPRVGLWMGLHAALVICLPRLYFGLHHPSDIVGGALIGVGLVGVLSQLPQRRAITDFVLALERRSPAGFYALGFLLLFEFTEMFDSLRGLALGMFRVIGR